MHIKCSGGVVLSMVIEFAVLADRVLHQPDLITNPKFSSNTSRVTNRKELVGIITEVLMPHTRDYWLKEFNGLG